MLASTLLAVLALEGALQVAGRIQKLDYRIYLQEMVNPIRVPMRIWNTVPDPTGTLGLTLATRFPPFRPGVSEMATTSEYAVLYHINRRGWRDGDHDYAKPAGVARVVALGDSFTFGAGVAYGERFVDVAARLVPGLEIVDMGVPGYGLDQALLAFIAEGTRYQPDAAVVFLNRYVIERKALDIVDGDTVHVPDDLKTAIPHPLDDADTAFLRPGDPLLTRSPPIVRSSYLLSYATYRYRLWRLHDRLVANDEASRPLAVYPGQTLVDSDPAHRRRTVALLNELRDRAAAVHARLIVVDIDDLYRYPFVADVPGVTYHDLAADLHERDRTTRVRYQFDRHYTADTHRFIGERVAPLLRADLGLDGTVGAAR